MGCANPAFFRHSGAQERSDGEPGIHNHDREYGFRAHRFAMSRNDEESNDGCGYTTGTRLAATAAGEITSISSGTRQRSVKRTRGSALLADAPSSTKPLKPLLITSLHFCT